MSFLCYQVELQSTVLDEYNQCAIELHRQLVVHVKCRDMFAVDLVVHNHYTMAAGAKSHVPAIVSGVQASCMLRAVEHIKKLQLMLCLHRLGHGPCQFR